MTVDEAPIGLFEGQPGTTRESFTITALGGGGFEAIAVALGRRLERLAAAPGQHNAVLDVSDPHGNKYVQCIVERRRWGVDRGRRPTHPTRRPRLP